MRGFGGGQSRERLRITRLVNAFAVVGCGLALAGCGSRGPAVHFVEGIVTLDGVPLAGADVGFSPVTAGEGLSAVGGTRGDGSFTLNAVGARPGRGTLVGDYVVTIRKFENKHSQPVFSDEKGGRGTPPPVLLQPGKADPPVPSVVPEVYGSQQTSPLKVAVVAGANSFRFELQSNAK